MTRPHASALVAVLFSAMTPTRAAANANCVSDIRQAGPDGSFCHGSTRPDDPGAAPAVAPNPMVQQAATGIAGSLGGALGAGLVQPLPPMPERKPLKPVVNDSLTDDAAGDGRIHKGVSAAQDVLGEFGARPAPPEAGLAAQRAFVEKKVKYVQGPCDVRGDANLKTGIDCSCLMLKGNPDYFRRPDGEYARTAQQQHDMMVAKGDDSLPATQLQAGDLLYLRGAIDDPNAPIAHTGRVTAVQDCSACSGCAPKSADVCVKVLHAPHEGKPVTEENMTLHDDKDHGGKAAYCIHKKDGTVSQCLTGGGRFP